ncbi:SAM-dependent methyltransferase [Prosthecobacter sp. SYSU 5D2]|uniref:class I SAM-dependent methyltransferase n=1 Tax=Prosthecobacter sp. SYSU 5D2 TaxID=3134134 RepID=UPI0031FF0E57
MTTLTSILHDKISASFSSRLTFAEVMDQALYHPEYGYYGPGPRRIGRSGDFYTAVSVGPLYGRLLGKLALELKAEMGSPADFVIIEQAAHDGQLAEDILAAVDVPYFIVEPNPRYEDAQRQRLAHFEERVRWVASLADLPAVPAFYVCNELPDAMPVHLVRWDGAAWQELYVQREGDGLGFIPGPPSSEKLAAELKRLPVDLGEGYTTEVNLAALDWMAELAAAPFCGAVYVADYGFDEAELYSPERKTGTLRRYKGHQTDDRVLEDLGECDLTTHVNFTRLIEVAESAGMKLRTYELQGRFLGKLGLSVLAGLEGKTDTNTQALLRQYHSLTHPAFMGRLFRVLMLYKR